MRSILILFCVILATVCLVPTGQAMQLAPTPQPPPLIGGGGINCTTDPNTGQVKCFTVVCFLDTDTARVPYHFSVSGSLGILLGIPQGVGNYGPYVGVMTSYQGNCAAGV